MSGKSETVSTVTTVNVDGVEYELRKNMSHTHCRGCALKYENVKDCHRHCANDYVLQKAKARNGGKE